MQLKGIDKKTLEKIEDTGYTLESLALSTFEILVSQLKVDEEKAKKIIESAQNQLGIHPVTALKFLELEAMRGKVTTSSNELDGILGGGIWTQELTEVAGGFGSGKTQLCFQLCINVQLPKEEGGLGGNAFFIDTERTFSPRRIVEIASYRDLDVENVLKNIIVASAINTNHLFSIVDQLNEAIPENNIRLLVVDSFASHFRSEFIGKDRLVERQQKIMQIAEKLILLAVKHDIAIIVTNQIIANVEEFLFGSPEEPALGFAWAHRPQQRIFMRKSRGSSRIARLFDSSRMPEREALFYVNESGITDAPFPTDFHTE
ncbi:MAG: DNA repair and recombination protein RadA [Candidatus Heimdallarchaeota archaeon]|nr:DNA repair and recombination protein RadA [Candidatus Heimdallarchaeota archaeon]MCK4955475.1 DNA repair and recombination protein RadA [Candidatus Heimdallarchaeota archaeon]